jgi:hypothetical protein
MYVINGIPFIFERASPSRRQLSIVASSVFLLNEERTGRWLLLDEERTGRRLFLDQESTGRRLLLDGERTEA